MSATVTTERLKGVTLGVWDVVPLLPTQRTTCLPLTNTKYLRFRLFYENNL